MLQIATLVMENTPIAVLKGLKFVHKFIPGSSMVLYNLARVYLILEQVSDSQEYLTKCIDKDPSHIPVRQISLYY
jgi:predicted Zn-dependent protease